LVAAAAIASLPTAGAQARTRRCGVITTTNHAGGSARWVVTVASGPVSCTTARRVLSEGLSLGSGNPRGWRCGPPATGAGLRCRRGPNVIVAAPARSAGMCGFGLVDGTYLTSISRLRNVSCAEAKRVYLRDKKLNYCTSLQTSQGWTIRHLGSKDELHLRFTKGNMAFDVMSEGSCY